MLKVGSRKGVCMLDVLSLRSRLPGRPQTFVFRSEAAIAIECANGSH